MFTCFNAEDYRHDAAYVASDLGWETDWFFSNPTPAGTSRRAIVAASGRNPYRSLWVQKYATARAKKSAAGMEVVGCNEAFLVTEVRKNK